MSMATEEKFARVVDDGFDQVARTVDRGGAAAAEDLGLLEDIFQRRDDERVLGREVMQLRSARKARFGGDVRGPEARIAAAANEVCRRL